MTTLHELQTQVHVAKGKRNDFGGYNYRTAEGILAAIKAALPAGGHIVVTDTMQEVAGQIFVTATAKLHLPDGGDFEAQGHALHPLTKKGMDPSQITGSASSYARKYALAGLVALDDGSVDPDAAKTPYEEDNTAAIDAAIDTINSQPTMADLQKYYLQLGRDNRAVAEHAKVVKAKDVKKAEFEGRAD